MNDPIYLASNTILEKKPITYKCSYLQKKSSHDFYTNRAETDQIKVL